MAKTFNQAINDKVNKLDRSKLTPNQIIEYDNIQEVINRLEQYGPNGRHYYYYYIPFKDALKPALIGMKGKNKWGQIGEVIDVKNVKLSNGRKRIIARVQGENNTKPYIIYLNTIAKDWWVEDKYKKYFNIVTPTNYKSYIEKLKTKLKVYEVEQKTLNNDATKTINKELNKYEDKKVINREAIKKAIFSTKKDINELDSSFRSGLSEEEKTRLVDWIKHNIYTIRVYVLKDSQWDQALTNLYPEDIYGPIHRTIPSDSSNDGIKGYISFYDIKDAPVDILKKIVQKGKGDFISSSNKYILNNSIFALWLLQNYNKDGIRLAKRYQKEELTK